jgi:hypothetical protein
MAGSTGSVSPPKEGGGSPVSRMKPEQQFQGIYYDVVFVKGWRRAISVSVAIDSPLRPDKTFGKVQKHRQG